MTYKRILTVQDISCVGQCSMTVALPILSACGHETCILPTAVLSSHTGGFHNPTFRDLSQDIPAICSRWQQENIRFDLISTGYLGTIAEIDMVRKILQEMTAPGGITVVDPAMADNGRLYQGFDKAYALAMRGLCAEASVIIPNLTEAAMMTGTPWQEIWTAGEIEDLLRRLEAPAVVLTGVSRDPGMTGVAVYENGSISWHSHKRIPRNFHGTGDIFAAALTGAMACDKSLSEAASIAADFTFRCAELTAENPAHWYGVKFEPALPELIEKLK